MSQPPNDQSGPPAGQPEDQPAYGQPTYGAPSDQPPPSGPPLSAPYPDPQQPYGQPYNQPYNQPYGQPGWSQPSPAQYGTDVRQTEAGYAQLYGQKQRTGLAVAALVLGILGILGAWFPLLSYVAVVLAVLAVIFGLIAMRRPAGKGMAITGLILGAISLVVSIWLSIIYTQFFIEVGTIIVECQDETGRSSGPAFDRCVDSRTPDQGPFG